MENIETKDCPIPFLVYDSNTKSNNINIFNKYII